MFKSYFSSYMINIRIHDFLEMCRTSRRLILFIVFVALFLDNMLLTTVGEYVYNDDDDDDDDDADDNNYNKNIIFKKDLIST